MFPLILMFQLFSLNHSAFIFVRRCFLCRVALSLLSPCSLLASAGAPGRIPILPTDGNGRSVWRPKATLWLPRASVWLQSHTDCRSAHIGSSTEASAICCPDKTVSAVSATSPPFSLSSSDIGLISFQSFPSRSPIFDNRRFIFFSMVA